MPHSELLTIAEALESARAEYESSDLNRSAKRLSAAAQEIGKAWSGSWLGHQAYVYYDNLQPKPPDVWFDPEVGLNMGCPSGWKEYGPEEIETAVLKKADVKDEESFDKNSQELLDLIDKHRSSFISIVQTHMNGISDQFLEGLLVQAQEIKIVGKFDILNNWKKGIKLYTRDTLALNQGCYAPPHIMLAASAELLGYAATRCKELEGICRYANSHMQRKINQPAESRSVGTKVFIGHGHSPVWRELKEFLQEQLSLSCDEFNRVPVAGITNQARLTQMLDNAAIAFIVMTAEEGSGDGKMRARMNVCHEAGLFQGRLGFKKTIILLEEGCDEFSNIQGLGQIRFPHDKISAAFEEIRQVLEREEAGHQFGTK